MNDSVLSKKESSVIIYASPFNQTQYLFKSTGKADEEIANLKQLMLNQSKASAKLHQHCSMLNNSQSSMLFKTRDQSKLSIDHKANASLIQQMNISVKSSGRSRSIILNRRTPLKRKPSHAKATDDSLHDASFNQSCNLNSQTIKLFHTNIKEVISPNRDSQLMNSLKKFPIISQKKKVQNVIPTKLDLSQIKSAQEVFMSSYYPVDRAQKKRIVKYVNSINQEVLGEYANDFVLVENCKFSEGFQLRKKLVESNEDRSPFSLNEMIISSQINLNKHVNREMNKQVALLIESSKRKQYFKLKRTMIKATIHMQKWGISAEDFFKGKYIEVPSFTGEELYLLLCAIKELEYQKVDSMITLNRYLLLDSDYFGQTPLHWAAKKNMFKIITYIVKRQAQTSAVDKANRTPLHIAAQLDHFESVVVLLFAMSDPFARTTFGARPCELAKTVSVQYLLKRAEELYHQHKGEAPIFFNPELRRSLKFVIDIELMIPFKSFSPFVMEY